MRSAGLAPHAPYTTPAAGPAELIEDRVTASTPGGTS
jgi:hypothetical protein